MENRLHTCLFITLTTFLLFLLSQYLFGFYAETNDDLAFVWGMKGYVSLQPITDFLYYHHGLASIYTGLYGLTDKVAWYGWLMYAYLLIGSVLVYFILEEKEKAFWQNLLLYLAFFTAILYSQLIYFNFTRPAFLLIISSFLWVLKREINATSSSNARFYSHIGWLLLFTIGFLTRPTTAYLSLTLLFPISIYLAWQKKTLKSVSQKIYVPILILIIGFHLLQWATNTPEKQAIVDKQAAIAQLVNTKITKNPEQWTRRDSIIHKAAIYWLVGDNETVTKEQLSKYTFEGEVILNKTTLQKIPTVLKELQTRIWQNYKSILCWLLVLIGASIWELVFRRKRTDSPIYTFANHNPLLAIVLFQLFFVVILVGVNITMKMPNRVLEPLLLLNMLVGSMLLPSEIISKNALIGTALAMLLLAYFPAQNTFTATSTYQSSQTKRQEMVAEFNQKTRDKTVVFTLPAATLLEDAHPLKPLNLSPNNRYVFLQGWLTALPNFYASLSQNKNNAATTFKGAFLNLVDNEQVIFISNEDVNRLLTQYFAEVYGVELVFEEVKEGLVSFEEREMKKYFLKSKSQY